MLRRIVSIVAGIGAMPGIEAAVRKIVWHIIGHVVGHISVATEPDPAPLMSTSWCATAAVRC